ncbi:MAG: lysophospholipid acyltransferase family protein [Actinomycetota bacterium]
MEPVYVVVSAIVRSLLRLLFRWKIDGLEKLPKTGPAIVAPNHISNFDPLCVAYLVDRSGRRPRFLAKASLWRNPFMRFVFSGCRQIPVERGSGDVSPTRAAEEALHAGEVIVVYPEGTITTNLDLTPMRGKTGVARLTLATGVPVYPVAVWGAQWLIGKGRAWKYRGHRLIMLKIGDPMRFDEFAEGKNDPVVLREVTDRVTAEIDRMVRELHKVHPDGGSVPELTPGRH